MNQWSFFVMPSSKMSPKLHKFIFYVLVLYRINATFTKKTIKIGWLVLETHAAKQKKTKPQNKGVLGNFLTQSKTGFTGSLPCATGMLTLYKKLFLVQIPPLCSLSHGEYSWNPHNSKNILIAHLRRYSPDFVFVPDIFI